MANKTAETNITVTVHTGVHTHAQKVRCFQLVATIAVSEAKHEDGYLKSTQRPHTANGGLKSLFAQLWLQAGLAREGLISLHPRSWHDARLERVNNTGTNDRDGCHPRTSRAAVHVQVTRCQGGYRNMSKRSL